MAQKDADGAGRKQNLSSRERFAQTVSLQGLTYVFCPRIHPLRRLFWALLLCGAITFTAYNISQSFMHYLDRPISVSINTVSEEKLNFPKVTLCNFNTLSKALINATPKALDYVKVVLPLPFSSTPNPVFDNTSELWKYSEAVGWGTMYRILSVKPLDMIVSCTWEGVPCVDGFFEISMTDLGVCLQTNDSLNLTAKSPGRDYGLQLILDAHQEDYFNPRHTLYGAGFKIAIHTPETPATMRRIAYSVGAGMYNSMSMKMKKRVDLVPDVTNCNTKALKYFDKYSTQACQLECLIDYVVETCGCREEYMAPAHLTHVPVCNPKLYYMCILPTFSVYVINESACLKTCTQSCSEVEYIVSMSQAPLSNFFLREFASYYRSGSSLTENLVLVDIYYSDLGYESMTRTEAYDMFSFFCDIGGALGLITGASILTLFEMGDFLACLLYNYKMLSSKTKVKPSYPEK